jgi:hypothetical protein
MNEKALDPWKEDTLNELDVLASPGCGKRLKG